MKNFIIILTLVFGALLLTPTSAEAGHRRSRGYHSSHGRVVIVVHPRRHRVSHHYRVYHHRRAIISHSRHHYRHRGHVVIIRRHRH